MSNYPAGVSNSDFNHDVCPDCGHPPNDGDTHDSDCVYRGMSMAEIR